MRIHHIWCDESGVSHFGDMEVEWVDTVRGSKRSRVFAASGLVFRQNAGDYALDWHPAPRKQFIVNLDAGVKLTVGDGESRVVGAGEVILAEDLHGKGHLSQSLGDALRHTILIHAE